MSSIGSVDSYLRAPDQPLVTKNWRYFGFVNGLIAVICLVSSFCTIGDKLDCLTCADVGEAMHSFLPKSLYVHLFDYSFLGFISLLIIN
jgi:hypothetical protein